MAGRARVDTDTIEAWAGDGGTIATPAARPTVVTTIPLPKQSWLREHEHMLVSLTSIVFFLVVWQVVAPLFYSPLFLPSPLDIVKAFKDYVTGGEIAIDLATSGQEFIIGYALAAICGIPLGIAIGWYPRVRDALDPFITFFYVTPRIALIPLLIIWFGIGIESKVAV
ncbi:MAG: hypothetical protein KGQ88_02035, partial [Chloroflexi bacterium]|nr:hypothetical protein [Chloroflexota bacterium]